MTRITGPRAMASLLLAGLVAGTGSPGVSRAADPVSLILNAPPNGFHAGIIYAQRKGYYAQEGLAVTIEPGRSSGQTIRTIYKSQRTFGIGELAAAVEARNEGLSTQGVTLLVPAYPGAIVVLQGSGVRSPADLKGRRLAGPASSFSRILFPWFAQAANLALDEIRLRAIPSGTGVKTLLEGKADAVTASLWVLWRYEEEARQAGRKVVAFSYPSVGVRVYSLSLLAPAWLIQEEEGIVRRMVSATVRGMANAMMNPAEALALFRQSFPQYPGRGAEAEWRVFLENWTAEEMQNPGFGFYQDERVKKLQTLLIRGRLLTQEFKPSSFYTNRFVPKVAVRPARF